MRLLFCVTSGHFTIVAMAVAYLLLALLATAAAAPGRLHGGQHTTIEQEPHMVALTYMYPNAGIVIQRCVGSLVSSFHTITSGFCFTGSIQSNFFVRAGSTHSLSGGTVVTIREVNKHPQYAESPRANDIAVVHLETPLGISNVINVLYLPPANWYIPDGQEVKVVSWGFDAEWPGGTQMETLKSVRLNKIPLADCQAAYAGSDDVVIEDPVICAKGAGQGMCFGDAGAPMAIDNVLVGSNSFYTDCNSDGYPDVFARVDRYTNWILEVATSSGRRESSGIMVAPIVA